MFYKIFVFLIILFPAKLLAQCKDTTRADPYHYCGVPYHPVCGCDGVTYRSFCAAEYWGGLYFPNWSDGICQNTNFDFDFVPNPVSSFSLTTSDALLHIYTREDLFPIPYSVYVLDIFNKIMFQWDDVATTNDPLGSSDWGTPVSKLDIDLFSKFPRGMYILVVTVNGEQKTKKIEKVDIQ